MKTSALALVAVLTSCLLLTPAFAFQKDGQSSRNGVQTVVAGGAGLTNDAALKDAFRDAVQQVMGVVVDGETLVKNDQLINDKVLTYSDGYIKTYKKLSDSTSQGLVRIKIEAVVERRSLVQKLKAENIKVKRIDGKGLFAEALTQMDAEQNTLSMLKKSFAGFPQELLSASVVGRPEILEKSESAAKVRIKIRVEADRKAYEAFAMRLTQLLDKLASEKGNFTAVFKPRKGISDRSFVYYEKTGYLLPIAEWMPKSVSLQHQVNLVPKEDKVTVAVATQSSKLGDRLDCRYFRLDKVLQPFLADVAFRNGTGELRLVNAEDETVVRDQFALFEKEPGRPTPFRAGMMSPFGMVNKSSFYLLATSSRNRGTNRATVEEHKKKAIVFWINPVMFVDGGNRLDFRSAIFVTRDISLSLDELKSVQQAKCEIQFDTLRE